MSFLVMVALLIMVTETDCKAANKYEYAEGAKPVYMKKLLRVARSEEDDDGLETDALGRGRRGCCCPNCSSYCTCCC